MDSYNFFPFYLFALKNITFKKIKSIYVSLELSLKEKRIKYQNIQKMMLTMNRALGRKILNHIAIQNQMDQKQLHWISHSHKQAFCLAFQSMLTRSHWNQRWAVNHIVYTIWMCLNTNWTTAWHCMVLFQLSMVMGKNTRIHSIETNKIGIQFFFYLSEQREPLVYSGWMQPKHGLTFTIATRKRMFCLQSWIWWLALTMNHLLLISYQRVESLMHSFCWENLHKIHSNSTLTWLALLHCHRMQLWLSINAVGIITMRKMLLLSAKTLTFMIFQWIR